MLFETENSVELVVLEVLLSVGVLVIDSTDAVVSFVCAEESEDVCIVCAVLSVCDVNKFCRRERTLEKNGEEEESVVVEEEEEEEERTECALRG